MQRWIIGLASGTSADGVDAALLAVRGVGLEMRLEKLQALHQPLSPELREMVRRLDGAGGCEPRQIGRLHRLLGETFAAAARSVADAAGLALSRVQVVGCAGHTAGLEIEGRFPGLLSLGMPAVIAERTGVTVVSDYRARDLAAGGQGVPLGALPDHILYRHPTEGRLMLHLGGIARVVYLPPACRLHEVTGFEAGPCNILLDTLVRHLTGGREGYDPGGKHAVQGRCLEPLLQSWLAHPSLQRRPPRSLPRQAFGEEFTHRALEQLQAHQGSLHDLLCTATHFVARSISASLRRYLPASVRLDRVFLSGGGVRNGFLLHLLQQQFSSVPFGKTDDLGVPAEQRKAVSHGLLAALTLDGVPGNAPSATGAAASRLLGSLTPGSSANWARCLHWMAQQVGPVAAQVGV
ncbi:MAG: anhydro-N-acetylmuramic acid kinase [Gemmataceae bacterium]